MRGFLPLCVFVVKVSALVAQPGVTPAPQNERRLGGDSTCGYFYLDFNWNDGWRAVNSITCGVGTPCLVATALTPNVLYCSNLDDVPVTTIFPYGNWPFDGCGPGSACCPAATPAVGEYLFESGNTVALGCNSIHFTYTAFLSLAASASPASPASPVATEPILPTSTLAVAIESILPISTLAVASPILTVVRESPSFTALQAAPSSASPSSMPNSSSSSSQSAPSVSSSTIVVIVGASVALIGFAIFLWFLYKWKKSNNSYQPVKPGPGYNSHVTQAKAEGGLTTAAKVATITSCLCGIAGLAVSIFFSLKKD